MKILRVDFSSCKVRIGVVDESSLNIILAVVVFFFVVTVFVVSSGFDVAILLLVLGKLELHGLDITLELFDEVVVLLSNFSLLSIAFLDVGDGSLRHLMSESHDFDFLHSELLGDFLSQLVGSLFKRGSESMEFFSESLVFS